MNKSRVVWKMWGRRVWGGVLARIMIMSLVTTMFSIPAPALAAGNACHASSPPSAAYNVNVCITAPADGATLGGVRNVTATVTVTGTNPGIAKLVFYIGGAYVLTDFQTPFSFNLPTTKWVDGSRLLEVEALMKDGFVSQRASISVTFLNGILQPPVNNNSFTPRSGTTPAAGQSFTLAAAGDGAGGMTNAGLVADLINSWNPNLFFYLGDVYEQGTATEFHNWYGTSSTFFGKFRSITDPVVGNHEYLDGGTAKGYFDYWDNVPNYYSFDAAGWHIVALNSNCSKIGGCNLNSPQYQWLAADLAAHPNTCTIAIYHHPVYFVGPIDDPQNMNAIWALMAQNGVDVVLNGHDHSYQRWKPLDGTGAFSPGGITEFIVGGGGHGMQQFALNDNRLAVGFDTPSSFGALRLQLNQDGAGYQYVNTAGVILDAGSILCSGAPADTIPPSKPLNLNAVATDSNLVSLSWKASTDNVGVTGYDVYRNGGLLRTVPPGTSYRDGTVSPGTTYSYRIRARDFAGNVSSLSSAVSVTTPGLLFSDGFESGNFQSWTSATGLVMQQQHVYAGNNAVRATSSGTAAYANKTLSQPQEELYYRLWFKILSQGPHPLFLQRFRPSANGVIMGVFVNNLGKLSFRNDVTGVSTSSTTAVTPGVWHQLQTRVLINGAASETEIWLDDVRVDALSRTENFGTTPVGLVQLGETATGRTFDFALDRVALSTNFIDPADPPEVTLPPAEPGVDVWIGGTQQGHHPLALGEALQTSYSGVNSGAVRLISATTAKTVGSESVVYSVNNVNASFSEMMGLPNAQLDTTYWLPWYNNVDLDTQLRFGNVSNAMATIRVYVNNVEMQGSPFNLAAGASTRQSFAGVNNGPVKIVSNVPIVAAERVIYKVNGKPVSYSEMMGLPNSQLDTTYWLPWYNNVDLDTQLRFGNVSNLSATVHVYVNNLEMQGSPFNLGAGASTRRSFASVNNGPVKIVSTQPIVVAERVIYKVNGVQTSFSEMMGLPNSQLNNTYWLPWYDNVNLDTQLRFANVSNSSATVHVYIGGQEMLGSPFNLAAAASVRQSFVGVNSGPIKIVSNVPIVAAERVILKAGGTPTSFSEMMGLPNALLDTAYWLPWYNNVDLLSELRLALP